MPATLDLFRHGPITYESASQKEFNVINQLAYTPAFRELYYTLWGQRELIAALIKKHLGPCSKDSCIVLDPREWMVGSFNVCVLVEIKSRGSSRKLVFRCPMPHKLAESKYPGTVDEKLGCEVGGYVWIQEKCPEIRIPHLFGFGFSDGRHFTHTRHRPFYVRIAHIFRRYTYSLFKYPVLSEYVHNQISCRISSAYILLEYLENDTGEMLSNMWERHRGDPARMQRLFHGISRTVLSLARVPQAQIGSFQFNNDGTVTLTNRPLSCSVAILENDGAPRTIRRNDTYKCSESFVSAMLNFHDHRFLSQPNAIFSDDDCRGQMAVKTLLRALSWRHIKQEYGNEPLLLQLTDLHASNIFVDQDWNVTCLLDLEWICALPVETLDVPYWLTGHAIDEIYGERYDEFDKVRQEFLHILEKEEQKVTAEHNIPIS